MQRITSLVFLFSLLVIFTSVMNQTRADYKCGERLGTCDYCHEKCIAKYGPSSQSSCDATGAVPSCACFFECKPPPKTCHGGAGLCSRSCNENCCDLNCKHKYGAGQGFCNTLGTSSLCQCEYSC